MKLNTTKKDFTVGQKIFLIPLENARKRGIDLKSQIKEVTVTKIGNTKIYVDNIFIKSFDMNGQLNQHNYGYLPFLSEEKAIEYIDLNVFISKLKDLRFFDETPETVLKIKNFFEEQNLIKKD